MSEIKSILVGGLAILAGTPVIGAIAWVLWTYWWTNILVWVALIYLLRNYDSSFGSTKAWWLTKK